VVGFCEHGDEPSVYTKKAGIFYKLSDSFSNNILHLGVSKFVSIWQPLILVLAAPKICAIIL
jgi:hypothetical protein